MLKHFKSLQGTKLTQRNNKKIGRSEGGKMTKQKCGGEGEQLEFVVSNFDRGVGGG